ncbi:Endolytic murein transglycosylase [subsurface metagenome]
MKCLSIVLLILIIIVLLGCLFIYRGIYLPKEPGSAQLESFLVEQGEGAVEISINLKEQGLIKYSSLFRIYALIQGKAEKLQAGEYELSPGMNIPEIVDKLASGKAIKNTITIIEGWNLRDIGEYFEEKGIAASEEFFGLDEKEKKDSYFSQEFDFLEDKPKNLGLEGYLFPDTYEIFPGEELEEIIKRMLDNFDKKLTSGLEEEIASQGKSIFEIVIMASLIEKEVRTIEDKKIVSGILWKRLKNKMPLQVDATITYITGRKTTEITKEELKIDSPYNTYKYKGLPLGPISNPGLESIKAAIYFQQTEYWFYLSTPEGETIFSKTLKEHNAAKAEHLR